LFKQTVSVCRPIHQHYFILTFQREKIHGMTNLQHLFLKMKAQSLKQI